MLPQEKFLMFQPLRLFLMASEHSDGENLSVISTGFPLFHVKCCKDVGYVFPTARSAKLQLIYGLK